MYSKTYLVLKRINKLSENQTTDFEQLTNSFLKKRYFSDSVIRRLKKSAQTNRKNNYTIHPCTIERSVSYLLKQEYIKADYDELNFSKIEITESGADFLEQCKREKRTDIFFHIVIPLLSAALGAILGSRL